MEQSKLISEVIAKLKIAYPYYFKDLLKDLNEKQQAEQLIGLTKMYQDNLIGYRPETIVTSIDEIIKESKFMPTIAEIIEKCEKNRFIYENEMLEKMNKVGYFKNPRELEKAYSFLERNVIPKWFYEAMKEYGFVAYKAITNTSNSGTPIGVLR